MLRITTIDLEKDNDLHLCTVLYSVNRFDEERSVTLVVNLSFDFNTRVPSSPIKKEESRGKEINWIHLELVASLAGYRYIPSRPSNNKRQLSESLYAWRQRNDG
jgi:hypothetical protein